jgi:hypothetical protein
VAAGLTGSDAVFLAMGSVGLQASLQRIVIQDRGRVEGGCQPDLIPSA